MLLVILKKRGWNLSKLSYKGIWENRGMAPHILDLDICLCWFNFSENNPVIHCVGGRVGDIRSVRFKGEKVSSHCLSRGSRDSSAGIVTRLRVGRSGVRIPAEVRDFSLIQNLQTVMGPTQPRIQWVLGFLLEDGAVRA
jgi:hypothetical protein